MNPLGYVKLAGAAVIGLLLVSAFVYVAHLRSARDEALAQVASIQATNHELQAVHANDVAALAELQAAKEASEKAAADDAAQQQAVAATVVQWKEKIVHVPVPAGSCEAATPRDAAVLDGVRSIIARAAPADRNAGGQGDSAPGPPGGHSAAGAPGAAAHP